MFDIGMQEMIVIFIVALLVVGPKKLPELGKALGKGISELKKSLQDVKEHVESEVKEATTDIKESVKVGDKGGISKDLAELKQSLQDVKEQVETEVKKIKE